jgi:FdhD protein
MSSAVAISQSRIRRISPEGVDEIADVLAIEEPLEIRLGFSDGTHKAVSITMRTPGEDGELAVGFLFTEGILKSPEQVKQVRHCGKGRNLSGSEGVLLGEGAHIARGTLPTGRVSANTIRVDLAEGVELDLKGLERHFYTTSSCGVCGKSSIEALQTGAKKIDADLTIDSDVIHGLPETLRSVQSTFDKTGGIHASALFKSDGTLDIVREDVGRHNALDKVIGAKFLEGETPLSERILLVSGRASFELVQKALMAGIPILAAVGAPSSLAVELAKEFGMTLIGFVRDGRFNIYCGGERVETSLKLATRN